MYFGINPCQVGTFFFVYFFLGQSLDKSDPIGLSRVERSIFHRQSYLNCFVSDLVFYVLLFSFFFSFLVEFFRFHWFQFANCKRLNGIAFYFPQQVQNEGMTPDLVPPNPPKSTIPVDSSTSHAQVPIRWYTSYVCTSVTYISIYVCIYAYVHICRYLCSAIPVQHRHSSSSLYGR